MRYVVAFGRFWWDFVVGDDWRVAAGLAVSLALVWLLTHEGVNALLLAESVRREARSAGR
jgi:hypothetical protein